MTIVDKSPIEMSPKEVTTVLLLGAVVLLVLHLFLMLSWYNGLLPQESLKSLFFFNLDQEISLGTWYSTLLLFFAGLLTLFQEYYITLKMPRWNFLWGVLGWGLITMSLIEVASFHDVISAVFQGTHWTIFGIILVTFIALLFAPFLKALPRPTARLFVAAGVVYLSGALGVESATTWYHENGLTNTLGYHLLNGMEEFMEILGVIVYFYALLLHMAHEHFEKAFSITLTPEHPHPAEVPLFKRKSTK